MTSKEALKLLYTDAENYAYFNETEEDLSEIKAEYELIKQDLDRLEKLEKENKKLKEDRADILKDFKELEKVIEILKRFNFTIYTTKYNNDETEFKIYTDSLLETEELTQQEYDVLKEYL